MPLQTDKKENVYKRVGKLYVYQRHCVVACIYRQTPVLHQSIDKSTHSSTQNNVCANENKHVAKWKNTKIIKCNLLSKIVPGWFYTQAYNIYTSILNLRIQCFI